MTTINPPRHVTDEVISEVRRHKQNIAAEFNFDVVALSRSLQRRQAGDLRFLPNKGGQGTAGQTPGLPSSPP
jgi:hypothetical protein